MFSRSIGLSLAALLGFGTSSAAQTHGDTTGHAGMHMAPPAPPSTPSGVGTGGLLTGPYGTLGPTGRVVLDSATVRLAWSGDVPGSTRSWQLRRGSCSYDEGAVGASDSFAPIVVGADSAASVTATLAEPLDGASSYYVAVYASSPQGRPELACGPIVTGARAAAGADAPQMGGMAGMDHSGMSMPGMPAGHDMSGMSSMPDSGQTMNHVGIGHAAGKSPDTAGVMSGSVTSDEMMSLHMRMMADPVIRRRVMADGTMRQMLLDMAETMPAEHCAMMMRAIGDTAATTAAPHHASPKQAPKHQPQPAARSKPDKKPAPAKKPEPHAAHSHMPGMGKP